MLISEPGRRDSLRTQIAKSLGACSTARSFAMSSVRGTPVMPSWISLCYVGNNLASSYCERVNSCAKLIMTHDRTLLGDDYLEMLCFLRMNRTIIYYLKHKYPEKKMEWAEKQKALLLGK